MVKSNQRITKIKRDPIEELLKKAEATDVEDACQVQPQGMDLTPYPDMNNLRLWVRDYLLKGLNVIYNNDLTTDGQTYMTTIVDGLPLFTKLSKTIKQKAISTPFEQPVLTEDGTIGGSSFAVNGLSVMGTSLYVMTNPNTGYYYYGGYLPNQQFTYYNPDAIKLTSITFNNISIPSDIAGDILKTFKLEASNDNNDWITIGTYSRTNSTAGSGNDNVEVTTEYAFKYFRFTLLEAFNGNVNKQAVSYCRLNGIIETGIANVETSKPGLWLSNLCEPYQVSQAGGWLRQNLINDYYKEYTNLNSDTIGNYSFSYFQRGIIHRDAGSTHADNDSYCQHWSPSALGCISHDSLIIPTNNLRNIYTSYQTLAVPSDVDKQSYSETMSKDVEFTFVDNNNNIPLSTTTFNGRVVGDGWTFEYLVSGNHQGSGTWGDTTGCDCDAETVDCEECPHCWSCVSEDIKNSGLCITGEIQYQNADGTVCIQAVNECFQTIQASVQPNNTSNLPIVGSVQGVTCVSTTTGCALRAGEVLCGEEASVPRVYNGYAIVADVYPYYPGNKDQHAIWNNECTGSLFAVSANGKTISPPNSIFTCNSAGSFCSSGWYGYPGETNHGAKITKYFCEDTSNPPDLSQAQDNVDIYFCVVDEKKKQEAQGIPWNYTCGLVDRFTFSFSTTPCDDIYTKSYLVAENISISSLGDITNVNL